MTKTAAVTSAIKRDILQGKYTPGERLPGVSDIEQRFDVSTATAVKAMQLLVGEGLVKSRQGIGYFAVPPTTVVEDDQLDEWDLLAAREALKVAADAISTAQSNINRLLRARS